MQPASSAFDYAQRPVEHRLHLLGLPIAQGRKRGRPRELTFRERVTVAQAWGETLNRHAVHVHDRKRDRAMAKLQARFRALCAAKAHPYEIAKVRAAIEKIGRVTRVPIKPPDRAKPVIDKQLAKLFGITERMVRKCRTDPRMRPFMPHPVWIERDWVKAGRLDSEARELAKRTGAVREAGAAHAGQRHRQGWRCRGHHYSWTRAMPSRGL